MPKQFGILYDLVLIIALSMACKFDEQNQKVVGPIRWGATKKKPYPEPHETQEIVCLLKLACYVFFYYYYVMLSAGQNRQKSNQPRMS